MQRPSTQTFRQAMRRLPGGVCLITIDDGKRRTGMVTNSLMPVSLDPPELMVAINRHCSTGKMLTQTTTLGIAILAHSQAQTAINFSGINGLKGEQRYQDTAWCPTIEQSAWLPQNALASFNCRIKKITTHHQHLLVIVDVLALEYGSSDLPLTYWDGQYGSICCPANN